jgi:5'-nucleotidase
MAKKLKTKSDQKLFLLTNDDGYTAPGLKALNREIRKLGEVIVVAPDREQSASSHSLTLQRPLRINNYSNEHYSVDGTPTDSIMIAVHALLKGRKPDFVIAGVNHGPNMGHDVTYSGTVAAAIEGSILGIPSFAVSLADWDVDDYVPAARAVRKIVRQFEDWPFPEFTFLNINIPYLGRKPYKGAKITKLGKRVYDDIIVEKTDPRGKHYYWIGGEPEWFEIEGSDFSAVNAGYISITPLAVDMTSHSTYREFSDIKIKV